MRDRLVVALVSVTLAVVAVFLVERAYTTSALIHEQEQRKIERSAQVIASLLGTREAPVTSDLLRTAIFADEHVVYTAPSGEEVEAARHRSEGGAVGDHDEHDLTATSDVPGGGTVTLTRHTEVVDQRVADALLPLVLVALGLVLAAAVAAAWLAGRLARPFTALAEAAGRIGRGDFATDVPRSNVPEADAIARALRTSAADLGALVERERDFAAHASHQLRTPLTATRLELEELALAPGTCPEVATRVSAALGQLDRLNTTVAQMLDASRESRLGSRVDIDLAALVRDTVVRWGDLAPDRTVAGDAGGVVAARLPAGAVMQVLDILIGNAVTHGAGPITVSLSESPYYLEIVVADEGSRAAAAASMGTPVARGAGGLATATEIVESLGGRLRLTDADRTTFSLVLPAVRHETVGG